MKKWKCTICNYVHDGNEAPDICPICKVGKDKFIEFSDDDIRGVIPKDPKKGAKQEQSLSAFVTHQHLHPISIHIPNGVLPVAVIFMILGMIFKNQDFYTVTHYNMIMVLLSMPIVIITGFMAWKYKYKGRMTKVFKTKIYCSYIALVASVISVATHIYYPPGDERGNLYFAYYILIHAVLIAVTARAGYLGGRLVFK